MEIARGLKDELTEHSVYSEWVTFYLQEEEADLVRNIRETFDTMAREAALGQDRRQQLTEIFIMSSWLEGMFWETAYTMNQWPDLSVDLALPCGQLCS